jgi:hypothetical protein
MVHIFLGIFCLLIILGFEPPLLNQSISCRMKLILSHHLPKLPRLANPANSDLSRGFSDVHRREFQGG